MLPAPFTSLQKPIPPFLSFGFRRKLPRLLPLMKSFGKEDGGAGEGGKTFFKRFPSFPRIAPSSPFFPCKKKAADREKGRLLGNVVEVTSY